MEGIQQANEPGFSKEPKEFHPCVSKGWEGVEDAAKHLAEFVDPNNLLDRDGGHPRPPLVIFAFDEAHILTDNPPMVNRSDRWTLFSELRRVLRYSSNRAIFSFFLSFDSRAFQHILPGDTFRPLGADSEFQVDSPGSDY